MTGIVKQGSLVFFSGAIAGAAVMLLSSPAQASTLDLTTAGTGGYLNGAYFTEGGTLSGTGVFPAFVQVHPGGSATTEAAYNTTQNNVGDNGSSATFNHEIRISDLVLVALNGTTYYKFELDINEQNNSVDQYLSLDNIQVLTSTVPNQGTTPLPTAGITRNVYNLDAGTDNNIALNFNNEPGSGKYDMNFYLPTSLFAGLASTDYVYLYSAFGGLGTISGGSVAGYNQNVNNTTGAVISTTNTFLPGGNYGASDGFEEWALNTVAVPCPPGDTSCGGGGGGGESPVPEPASLLLLGSGLGFVARQIRRRTKA